MSKDAAVPRTPGYVLTKSGARRDDPVPGFQSRHAPPDLQHFSDAFVPSHGWQRGEDGVGPCREAGGELWSPSHPRPPHPRSHLRTLRDTPSQELICKKTCTRQIVEP